MPLRTCSFCKSTFSKVEHLKRHERSHTGEKPFQCQKCNKSFSRGDVLTRHLRGHDEQAKRLRQPRRGHASSASPCQRRSRSPRPVSEEPTVAPCSLTSADDGARPNTSGFNNINASQGRANATTDSMADLDLFLQTIDSPRHSPHGHLYSSRQHTNPPGLQSAAGPDQTNMQPPAASSNEQLTFTHPVVTGDGLEKAVPSQELLHVSTNAGLPDTASYQQQPRLSSPAASGLGSVQDRTANVATFDFDLFSHWDFDRSMGVWEQHSSKRQSQFVPTQDSNWLLTSFTRDRLASCDRGGNESVSAGAASSPSTRCFIEPQPFRRERVVSFGSDIPDERFARVARLWTKKGEGPWQLIQNLWPDVVSYTSRNVFSLPSCANSAAVQTESPTSVSQSKRLSMIQDCCSTSVSMERMPSDAKFPSAELLGICVDIYFRRFHPLMRFIHQPTFFSANAPNTVLFPMCLIGLLLLDPTRTRHFVTIKLSYAMEKCNASLSRDWVRSDSVGLVTNLASAVLLLSAAASIEEMVSSSITYALYTKALSVAQQHSLFEVEKGTPLSLESLGDRSDVDAWEAWARAESTKRMICCMIMVDSFFAANLGTSPIIRLDTLKLYAPCATYLFAADDAGRWSQLDTSRSFARQVTVESGLEPSACFPMGLGSSSLGLSTLLSIAWLRLADVRHRTVLTNKCLAGSETLIPGKIYKRDAAGGALVPILQQIYSNYGGNLGLGQPNHMIFWHNMCICLTADLDMFETGAGRQGRDSALLAIDGIGKWSGTPAARRACLHAAQAYKCMVNKKVTDGISFLSETALFNAALVLGFYSYVSPTAEDEPSFLEPDVFELLDDVDWGKVGNEGLPDSDVSRPTQDPAAHFIRSGGQVKFAGMRLPGGFGSARKVILEYVGLLEEVGKWKAGEFCRILRTLSDSPVDLDP